MNLEQSFYRVAGISAALVGFSLGQGAAAMQLVLGQSQKLLPTAPPSFHNFGQDVSYDGDTLLVGAPENSSVGAGQVYAFRRTGSTFALEQEFTPPGAPLGHVFGRRVVLQGDTAIIGADKRAYAYTRSGTTWSLQHTFVPNIGTGSYFASSVALDGNTAVIGQYGMTEARVWVYVRSGSTWSQEATLTPTGGGLGIGFGQSVGILGDTIVVGGSQDDDGGTDAGALWVFTRSGSSWTQQAKVLGTTVFPNRRLGSSLSVQDAGSGLIEVAVGASGPVSGRAYLFSGSGSTWNETATLFPSTGGSGSWFGASIDLDGDYLVVGAWRADTSLADTGFGTAYRRCGSTWVRQADLVGSDSASNDSLGISAAIQGRVAILGAINHDALASNAGAAYVFDLEGSALATFCHADGSGAACPCSNEIDPGTEGGCRNSSGVGGQLIGIDNLSVSTDQFRTFACGLLPGQPGLLFAGNQQLNGGQGILFGDGLRCAGVGVRRLGVKTPDANGEASWGPGLRATGGWNAGDTRYLQVWYRNPTGSPCGNGFNLTNGLRATFQP